MGAEPLLFSPPGGGRRSSLHRLQISWAPPSSHDDGSLESPKASFPSDQDVARVRGSAGYGAVELLRRDDSLTSGEAVQDSGYAAVEVGAFSSFEGVEGSVQEEEDTTEEDESLMDGATQGWPAEFVCPISRSVMADPVIVASGQTYERKCIEAWMELGQRNCVKHGVELDRNFMFPNTAVRSAVQNLARSRNLREPEAPGPELAMALARRLLAKGRSGAAGGEANSNGRRGNGEAEAGRSGEVGDGNGDSVGGSVTSGRSTRSLRPVEAALDRLTIEEEEEGLDKNWEEPAKISGAPPSAAVFSHSASATARPGLVNANFGRSSARAPPPRWSNATAFSHSASGPSLINAESELHQPLPPSLATRPASYSAQPPSPLTQQQPAPQDHQPRPPPPSSSSIDSLVKNLQKMHALEQESAAMEIRQLTRQSPENRLSLCRPDLLSALLPLIQSRYTQLQIHSVAAIVNLSLERQNKVKIVRAGAVPWLIDALKGGYPEAQEHAAGAIFSLALSDENKIAIGVLGAIPPLLHLLRSGPLGGRQDAAMALYHLSHAQSNRAKLVKVGAVPILLSLAQDERPDLASRALLILCNIAATPDGRTSLLELNAINTLVGLLAPRVTDRSQSKSVAEIREHAAAALLLLSQSNLRFKSMAIHAGAVELLMVLAEEGTPRAREKALALLAIMRESAPDPDDSFSDSILPRQHLRRTLGRTERVGLNSSEF